MKIFGGIIVLKQAALAALLSGVVVAASGCAGSAQTKGRVGSANLDKTEYLGSLDPNANTVYGMARLLRSQKKAAQAELVLLNLKRSFPNFSPTYNDLAEIRMSQNRFEEAVAYLNEGLEVAPNDVVLLNNAGVCSLLKHDSTAALAYFERASAIAPYVARYRANVALALGLNGQHEGSRTLFGQIVSRDDADFNAELIRKMTQPAESHEMAHVISLDTPPRIDVKVEEEEAVVVEEAAVAALAEVVEVVTEEAVVIEEVAVVAPAEVVEVEVEEAAIEEMAHVSPLVPSSEPADEAALVESIPEPIVEVDLSKAVEPSTSVQSLTNSDVEAHDKEVASIRSLFEVKEDVGDAPEAGDSEVGEPADAAHRHEDSEAVEVDTAAEADLNDVPLVDALVALATKSVESIAANTSALHLDAVEPEQQEVTPVLVLEDRAWVDSEFLLPVDFANSSADSDKASSEETTTD